MEVAGAYLVGCSLCIERPETAREQVDAAGLFLQLALNDQSLRKLDRTFVTFEYIGTNDHIDESRLILEREKNETLGGARTLARDHHSADFADEIVRHRFQTMRCEHAGPIECGTKVRDRLGPRREPE